MAGAMATALAAKSTYVMSAKRAPGCTLPGLAAVASRRQASMANCPVESSATNEGVIRRSASDEAGRGARFQRAKKLNGHVGNMPHGKPDRSRHFGDKIGRASCREREEMSGV